MESRVKSVEDLPNAEFFDNVKRTIEKELDNLKKTVNKISTMRVDVAYLESDLLMMINASTWENISELIGSAPMKIEDLVVKKEIE